MVESARSWIRENSTLVYFLIAQLIALVSGLAYIVNWKSDLESRVNILEVRGSPHLAEINNRLTVTEKETQSNKQRLDHVIEIMTRELGEKTIVEGKVAGTTIDAMKGTPVLLAMLIIIAGFLVFIAYTNGKTDAREQSHMQLISELAKECRKGQTP